MVKISLIVLAAAFSAIKCATLYNYTTLDSALANYDSRVRPFAGEKPVVVEISFYLIRAYKFDEVDHEFMVDVYFRQKWNDPRLSFSANSANDSFKSNHKLAEKIWQPDTFFPYSHSNDKLHDLTVPNVFLRVKPDGEVFFSGRYSLSVPCKKDPENSDKFACEMDIESYGFDTTDIDYKWKEDQKAEVEWPLTGFNMTMQLKDDAITLSSGIYKVLKINYTLQRKK